MKKILAILLFFIITLASSAPSFAYSEHTASAKLSMNFAQGSSDYKVDVLRDYLVQFNSPLANSASTFVSAADRYQLDWRLVAAISGVESTFGQAIPASSYNGWGWGVYGDNVIRFSSWDEAIETISKGIRERYLGDIVESDPYIIGPTYAASPTWAQRVAYFMAQIQNFEIASAKDLLSISL